MFLPSRVAAALCSSLLLVSSIAPVSAVWPIPKSFSKGDEALYLNQNVEITYNGEPVWWNSSPFPEYPDNLGDDDDDVVGGNKNKGNSGAIEWKTDFLTQKQLVYADGYKARSLESKEIVQAGVSRTMSTIFAEKFVPWMLHPRGKLVEFEPDVYQGQKWVKTFDIVQTGEDKPEAFKPLAGEVDESYNLTVSAEGGAQLTATSSIGVLRGLETFAQLFFQHSTGTFWYTPYAPVEIEDSPEYSHRGVMLDTARSWFPVKDILRTIDAIAWNKMNRLHIHVTDSQSWPLDIPSMPEVSEKGAYAPHTRYSPEDVAHIQEYGQHRGVEVYLEIDMPGHIGSVALSHPELIVAYDERPYYWWCAQPPCGAFKMNDTGVDQFLEKLFDDLLPRLEPYSAYFHTGGDELNKNDSMLDPGVGSNETEVLRPLLQKFIDAQHSRVRKHGLTPITWQEIPLEWEIDIGEDVVVHTWLGAESVKNLTSKGHKVFDSNYNFWVSFFRRLNGMTCLVWNILKG